MRKVWSGAAAVGTLTALVALFYRDILFRGLILGDYDAFVYFYPLRQYAADALRQGRFPLWNPDLFLGAPFFANVQTAVLYPPNLLFLWLPTPYAYSASVVTHLLLAGVAMYLFARRSLRVSLLPALLAATTFTFSGFLTGQIGHINQLTVAAWMPLLLVTFDEAVRRRSPALGIATGLIGTLQLLAGHTQEWYFSTAALGLLAMWRVIAPLPRLTLRPAPVAGGDGKESVLSGGEGSQSRTADVPHLLQEVKVVPLAGIEPPSALLTPRPPDADRPKPDSISARRWQRWLSARLWPVALLVAAGLVEIGVTAVQVLPSMELSTESIRGGGMGYWEAMSFSLPPTTALYSVLPNYPQQLFSEYVGYVGVVPLVLAALAVVFWSVRPVTAFMAGLVGFGFFMALGKYNPLYPYLFHWIPGLDLFRVPARWLLVYTFGLSGLAALGAQLVVDMGTRVRTARRPRRWRRMAVAALKVLPGVLVLGAALGLLALFYRYATPTPTQDELLVWGGLAAATLLLVGLGALGRRVGWVSLCLLIGMVAAELYLAGEMTSIRHPIPYDAYRPERSSTNYILGDAARWGSPGRLLTFATDQYEIKETPDYKKEYEGKIHPDSLLQFMVDMKLSEVLAANIPAEYGIETVDGYDGGILPLRRYGELKSLLVPVPGIPADIPLRTSLEQMPPLRLVDLLNVRYLLGSKIQDTRIDGAYYDRGVSMILGPGESQRLQRLPQVTTDAIGVISSTEGAREQKDGETAAIITVTDTSGASMTLPLRFGYETGETPERDAEYQAPGHRKPPLVPSWTPKEKGTEYYTRVSLPASIQVKSISVSNVTNAVNPASNAKVRIRALTLIDRRAATSAPLVMSDQLDRQMFFDMKLYTNRSPLPRAFMVHNSLVRSDDIALKVLAQPQLKLDDVVVLAPSPTARSLTSPVPGLSGGSEARVRSYNPEEVVVDTNSPQPGYLTVQDAFFPGWTAEVDGEEVPIERSDYLFRAVYLEAGQHTVVFRYAPRSFQVGLDITLASLGLLGCVLSFLGLRQRRIAGTARRNPALRGAGRRPSSGSKEVGMNVFNRIALSVILLGVIASALLFALMPGTVMESVRSLLDAWQAGQGSPMQFVGAVVGLLVAAAAFMLLVVEWRPSKRHSVVVTQEGTGTAELTNESVSVLVRRAAESVADIRDVSTTIQSHGKSISVLLRVSTDSGMELPRKTQEVMQAVRAEVETKMGIPIKSLKVTIKHSGSPRRAPSSDSDGLPKDPFRR